MRSQCLAIIKKSLFDFTQVAILAAPGAENNLRVQCEPLKHRFLDLNQVALWYVQVPENEFKLSCDPLKHRFLDLTQVAFLAGPEEDKSSHCPAIT